MEIRQITENKKAYLELLLMADEQEDMIDRYLDRGDLFVLYEGGARSLCVVTDEGEGLFEIKNLATYPQYRRMGYARALVRHVQDHYRGRWEVLQVGTGDSPLILPFYERLGFAYSHRVKNFFTDHYDKPIYEAGTLLRDMVYLRMKAPSAD